MELIHELHYTRERRLEELMHYCIRNRIYTKAEIRDMAKVRYGVNEQTARDYANTVRKMLFG